MLARGYIKISDEVKSLTHFFPVPKTWKLKHSKRFPDDIRMVYDATRSGLNKAVWASWVPMPTVVSHLRSVVAGNYTCDCDVGEIFLNFMLKPKLRPYADVDITCLFSEDVTAGMLSIRGWWERMLMNFPPSLPLPGYKGLDGYGEGDSRLYKSFGKYMWVDEGCFEPSRNQYV